MFAPGYNRRTNVNCVEAHDTVAEQSAECRLDLTPTPEISVSNYLEGSNGQSATTFGTTASSESSVKASGIAMAKANASAGGVAAPQPSHVDIRPVYDPKNQLSSLLKNAHLNKDALYSANASKKIHKRSSKNRYGW